jgi:hypothetical protein
VEADGESPEGGDEADDASGSGEAAPRTARRTAAHAARAGAARPAARGARRDVAHGAVSEVGEAPMRKKKPPIPWLIAGGLGAAVLLVGLFSLLAPSDKPKPRRPAVPAPVEDVGNAKVPKPPKTGDPSAGDSGGVSDAEQRAFDRKLNETLKQLKALGPDEFDAKVALAESLAKAAPDVQSTREVSKILNGLEDAADAENAKRFKAAQEKAAALAAEGKLKEAVAAWDAFQPVFDRRGAWKPKAKAEREALAAKSAWEEIRKQIDEAIAKGQGEEAEALMEKIPAAAASEAVSAMMTWRQQIAEARKRGAERQVGDARKRRFETGRPAADQRVLDARAAAARETKENAERDSRLAAALKDLTARAPLRIPFTKDFVLDKVQIAGFAGNRVKLAWPQGEMDYPVDKLPTEALGLFSQALVRGGTAIDHLHVGKLYLHCRQLDRADACFKKARELDAAIKPLLPDMERIRRATQPFLGDYRAVGNDLAVTWGFDSAEESKDFLPDANVKIESIPGTGLQVSGDTPSPICRVKDIPFMDRLRVWATPGESNANHLVGVRFIRPDGTDALLYVLLKTSAKRFLVNSLEGRQTTNLVPEKAYEGEGAISIGYEDGKLTVAVEKESWSGTASGFTNVLVILGTAGEPKASKRATYRQVALSGQVNPQWIVKQTAAFQDVLITELGREHRALAGDPGDRGLPPLSLDPDLAGYAGTLPGQYKEAVSHVAAFFKAPDNATFHKAWTAMEAIAKGNPGFAPASFYQARLIERAHSRAKAAQFYDEAIRRCPEFPEALATRARLHAESGAWNESREANDKALQLLPDLAEGHLIRARLLLRDGQGAKALEETALAEKLAPLDADLRRRSRMLRNVIHGPGWLRENKVETEHFRVRSDLPIAKLKGYAQELEAVRGHYAQVLPLVPKPGAERVDVLLFNTTQGYFGYVEFAAGDRLEHTSGAFIPWYGQLIFFENANPDETRAVMYHEGLHRFLYDTLPDAPIWLQEGVAEYVAGTRLENGKVAASGLIRAGRLQNMKMAMRYGWKPLAFKMIMNETQGQFYALNPPLQYAQAWSMVHFFIHGEDAKYKSVFEAYVKRLESGDELPKAFDETFGKENVDEMQKQWLKYVNEMKS